MKDPSSNPLRRQCVWLAAASAFPLLAAAQSVDLDKVHRLPQVEVVHQAPLPGLDVSVEQYPGNAQLRSDAQIERSGATNLADFLNRSIPGVSAADIQGSPYQIDLSYRGHRLSPLLGSPQGLSVYLDGVRVNQPLGDVMDWDLVPEMALADVALIPGTNPLYGLNTLGGALVLGTKSGWTHPGTEVDVAFGSHARKRVEFGHGARWGEGWHGYVAGTWFDEDGWRERSPGNLGNLFLKLGRNLGDTSWALSYSYGRSNLIGNGLLNQSLYDIDRRAGYTFYDQTRNRGGLLNFSLTHALSASDQLSLVAWHRSSRRQGSNGDVNEDWAEWIEDCERPGPTMNCTDPDAPGYIENNAVFNRSQARYSEVGATLQWSRQAGAHHIAAGVDMARSSSRYDQFEQEAMFDAHRVAQPLPGEDPEHDVSLRGRSTRLGLFVADTVSLSERTQLSLSARWNMSRVRNDLGHPAPYERESFSYRKLNPAIGITHAFTPAVVGFASLSQGTRMPTALELGCADPQQPCTLPTGLQADPYLKQVVTRTLEFGARLRPAEGVQLTGAVFRSVNDDDIVFMRSGVAQAGFFDNIGKTRRQGLELSARLQRSDWDVRASYGYLDATFRSSGVLFGPLSTTRRPNQFHPGTRIAALPRHVFKLSADWRATPSVVVGGDLLAASSQVVAGNEGGSRPTLGKAAGYSLLNARATWQFSPGWKAYLRVNNVLDKRYVNYVTGNEDAFPGGQIVRPGDDIGSARFVAPGAGRSFLVGVRYEWR
ncbi:TonB-dependent receptor [Melaminivora suipulveris]|uniref:TonB-dependent receptor n=1 Tax=Melaminivora suipulveris TaxID=2109913 RepID=A0A2R3QDE7_9BURK|nr:TonB-dependent receptor [Melaminivora suipulveris]AVO49795.1 TonB-dependent receptor [Melaminivora suipulveris]